MFPARIGGYGADGVPQVEWYIVSNKLVPYGDGKK